MPDDCMLTSFAFFWISFRILNTKFSIGLTFVLDWKSAAVFFEPATWAMAKLYCKTQLHAFQSAGGMSFAEKKRVTDRLSLKTMTG